MCVWVLDGRLGSTGEILQDIAMVASYYCVYSSLFAFLHSYWEQSLTADRGNGVQPVVAFPLVVYDDGKEQRRSGKKSHPF